METPMFNIIRSVYDPQPIKFPAASAKYEIQTQGGEFFIISVNGCDSPEALIEYVINEHNIPLPIAEQALELLANTKMEGFDEAVSDTWAVVEKGNGDEGITKFVTFAFAPEEINVKTDLFVEGMKQFKSVLSNFISTREKNQQWTTSVTAIDV